MSFSAKNISIAFGAEALFENISFSFGEGDRIAIVGINGAGKSTLMRIVAGVLEPDSGSVVADDWIGKRYVPQGFKGNPSTIVRSYIDAESSNAYRETAKLLASSEFDFESVSDKQLGILSGGQQRMIQLSRAFASGDSLLLLDEPENHLDYYNRLWLIEQMKAHWGTLLFVSHDQYLISEVATSILEIENGKLKVYPGNYNQYLDLKAAQETGAQRQHKQWQREIKRHHTMVMQMKDKAKLNSDVAAAYRNKKKQFERLREAEPDRVTKRRDMNIRINGVEKRSGKRVVSLDRLGLVFGSNEVLAGVSADMRFGEKVLFFGRNGSGKSSLINMILDRLEPTSGELKLGNDLRITHYSQEHADDLELEITPIQELMKLAVGGEGKARSLLARFLIPAEMATRPIHTLSGGQKARLRFAKLFVGDPEVLVLDEPTNDLDRQSWEILRDALKAYEGTIILVSHDRAFADEVCSKTWVFKEKDVLEFPGTLSEYLERETE